VAEDVSKTKVLTSGMVKGDIELIPVEGQTEPISMAGESEE